MKEWKEVAMKIIRGRIEWALIDKDQLLD